MEEYVRIFREMGLVYIYQPAQEGSSTEIDSKNIPIQNQEQGNSEGGFPEPYNFYLKKISEPVKVVWTYIELDEDFRVNPNMQRLNLWFSIMKAKGLQKHQVAFWPIELHPLNTKPTTQGVSYFFKFISQIHPRFIFCFGYAAQRLLQEQSSALFSNPPVPIVFLPGADEMLPDNKAAKRKAWDLLRPLEI
ncbi:hypothetical protein [Desulfonatronum parangueonense]